MPDQKSIDGQDVKVTNDPTTFDVLVGESTSVVDGEIVFTPEEEAQVVRKIDRRLLPLMMVAYALQFLDKISLGSAAVMGIREQLHLTGLEYSWASSIFYFGYLMASYPGSLGFNKLPLAKFLTSSIIIWGVILVLHSVTSNAAGLLVIRYFLGTFESVISPGFSLITAVWYKRSEHASRHGAWFVGNSVGSLAGAFISFGIAHITAFPAWKVLFILYGLLTFLWGILMIMVIPDSPSKARFLTERERAIAISRVSFKQLDGDNKYDFSQVREAFKDPGTYLIPAYAFLSCMGNGALTNFGPIVIQGFGYSTFNTLLLQVPNNVYTLLVVVITSWAATKFHNIRCFLVMAMLLIGVCGALMVRLINQNNHVGRLVGLYLFSTISCAFPLVLSLLASNVAGHTKKTFTSALFFITYCAGNIAGPQVFFGREAPSYPTAFATMIGCTGLAFLCILAYWIILSRENRRRDRQFGVVARADESTVHSVYKTDLTDFQQEKDLRLVGCMALVGPRWMKWKEIPNKCLAYAASCNDKGHSGDDKKRANDETEHEHYQGVQPGPNSGNMNGYRFGGG
ncbi:hypothetical protein ACHAPJ_013014 [Fusarium lateritium]